MHSFVKKICILFLFFSLDIFYFFITGTLVLQLTLCASLYLLFQDHSLPTVFSALSALGALGFIIYHSYTLYYISCLPCAIPAYLLRHYMGRKDFYLYLLTSCTLITQSFLLYFSPLKPIITLPYTFLVISCNLIVIYMATLKFPIVGQGNRL